MSEYGVNMGTEPVFIKTIKNLAGGDIGKRRNICSKEIMLPYPFNVNSILVV